MHGNTKNEEILETLGDQLTREIKHDYYGHILKNSMIFA